MLGPDDYLELRMCYDLPEGDFEMRHDIRETAKADNVMILSDFNYPHIDCVHIYLNLL